MGHNVYLTGPAGSGKTFLLNKFISFLKNKNVKIGITASTGIAATHLGGITLDSWSGIGIRDRLSDTEIEEMKNKLYLKIRYLGAKVLIIDEISMLSSSKFDLLDTVCRKIRGINMPFGGIQIVLCGDFFQLPPVGDNRNQANFIYKSAIWPKMNLKVCYLDQPYRQSDPEFLRVLNALRRNEITDEILQILIKTIGQKLETNIPPVKLYTHNVDVEAINNEELIRLNGEIHTFQMETKGVPVLTEMIKKSCLAPEKLQLKKDAVVMFVRNNLKEGYVNGTMGKVVGFTRQGYPVVETTEKKKITAVPVAFTIEENNIVKAQVSQIPLRLAWAITVHKSQGMTISQAEIDLGKSFLTGMGYVAMSRMKSLSGLRLLDLNKIALTVNPEVIGIDKNLRELSVKETIAFKELSWFRKIMIKRKRLYQLTA
jgi:ATP-dependent exoDNAse (exonuclease V) alpha subunit